MTGVKANAARAGLARFAPRHDSSPGFFTGGRDRRLLLVPLNNEGMERRLAQPFLMCAPSVRRCGTSRRSIAAFSLRRRAALFAAGVALPPTPWALPFWVAAPSGASGKPQPAHRQPAPGRHPLWCRAEPRRRPSAWVTLPHARGRRTRLHPRNVSRRRPSMSRTRIGIYADRNIVNSNF
jgi:hypothetical protein